MGKSSKTFSLEKETIKKIELIAKAERRTLSSIIELAIECYLNSKRE